MKKESKRGQITIFIILGISLLILIGAGIYLKNKVNWINPQPPEKEIVPTPIKEYIESCIDDTTREAVNLMVFQGGYIYFPERISSNVEAYIKLDPDGEVKLPLWYFRGMDNSPTINKMQNDLSQYIKLNIGFCLDNLSAFKNEYDIEEKGSLDVQTVISDNDINIKLIYPIKLTMKIQDKSLEVTQFSKKVKIKLKGLYDISQKIFNQENNDKFFEQFTIDLISSNEDMTPYTGFEIKCGKKTWLYTKVADNIKNMIETNLPFIKLNNTNHLPIPDVVNGESTIYMQTHYYWPFLGREYRDYKVSFEYYKDYPMQLMIRPRNGGVLESNTMKSQRILSYLCFNIWHFTYDVRYPIKVNVMDDSDPANPISMSFAMEISINHNSPDKTNFPLRNYELEDAIDNDEWCAQNQLATMTLIVEDENQPTNYGLEEVNVSFICGPAQCDMGQTSFDYDGVNAMLVKKFPYCVGGILRLSKENYIEKDVLVNTGKDDVVEATLVPTKDFGDITIFKHDEENPLIAHGLNFDINETVFIRITNDSFESFSVVPNSIEAPLKLLARQDYTYNLEIFLFKNEEVFGGYKGLWTPTAEELEESNNLVFHVIYVNSTDENEVMLLLSELELQSARVPRPEVG